MLITISLRDCRVISRLCSCDQLSAKRRFVSFPEENVTMIHLFSEYRGANKELTACRLSFLAIREKTTLSSKPLNNCLAKTILW